MESNNVCGLVGDQCLYTSRKAALKAAKAKYYKRRYKWQLYRRAFPDDIQGADIRSRWVEKTRANYYKLKLRAQRRKLELKKEKVADLKRELETQKDG